jgi:hypothetical protein
MGSRPAPREALLHPRFPLWLHAGASVDAPAVPPAPAVSAALPGPARVVSVLTPSQVYDNAINVGSYKVSGAGRAPGAVNGAQEVLEARSPLQR